MTEINENNLPIYLQNYNVNILCYDNNADKIPDNCDFSKFGCCADGITPKKNRNGSNCVPLCGSVRYNTVSVNPSNEKRKRVWNFKTSGTLKPHDRDYIIQYNFKDVDYTGEIFFENKISGNLNVCGRILDMSKFARYSYSSKKKIVNIIISQERWGFSIKRETNFYLDIEIDDGSSSCQINYYLVADQKTTIVYKCIFKCM